MKNSSLTTGEIIQDLRLEAGLSQENLARSLNVSRLTVSKWEHDRVNISSGNIRKLADFFGVSKHDLGIDQSSSISIDPPAWVDDLVTRLQAQQAQHSEQQQALLKEIRTQLDRIEERVR